MTQTKPTTTSPKRMNIEDTHMKAIVNHTYGSPDILKLQEVHKPVPRTMKSW